MRGFHLGSCNPNDDDMPATTGCSQNCPRWLWWQVEVLRDALKVAERERDQEELL